MAVIGLDPGSAITGYGILDESADHTLKVIAYGVLRSEAGEPLAARLQSLYDQLNEILVLHRPESGAVENLFFQRNVRTALAVGAGARRAAAGAGAAGIPAQNTTRWKSSSSGGLRQSRQAPMQQM
jgi:Holliday junction resolvasome, endonuclease subunit